VTLSVDAHQVPKIM